MTRIEMQALLMVGLKQDDLLRALIAVEHVRIELTTQRRVDQAAQSLHSDDFDTELLKRALDPSAPRYAGVVVKKAVASNGY